jgi:hypothetical protein
MHDAASDVMLLELQNPVPSSWGLTPLDFDTEVGTWGLLV